MMRLKGCHCIHPICFNQYVNSTMWRVWIYAIDCRWHVHDVMQKVWSTPSRMSGRHKESTHCESRYSFIWLIFLCIYCSFTCQSFGLTTSVLWMGSGEFLLWAFVCITIMQNGSMYCPPECNDKIFTPSSENVVQHPSAQPDLVGKLSTMRFVVDFCAACWYNNSVHFAWSPAWSFLPGLFFAWSFLPGLFCLVFSTNFLRSNM